MQDLRWDVLIKRRGSATQGVPPGKESLTWVSNSATLIYGERDAVLVDTFLSDAQTSELADWIADHDRTLTTIFITHGHPDHFFGLRALLNRFPGARAVAAAQVVEAMRKATAPDVVQNNWRKRWPGQVPAELAIANALDRDRFELEGNDLILVDTGHTDTQATTALHAPSIGLVIAGDAVYNDTHPFLLESGRGGRSAWIGALDMLEALDPRAVVVGHGPLEPDHSPRHIGATRQYLRDFDRLDLETTNAQELYDRMLALYPERINPGSLWGSSHVAKES